LLGTTWKPIRENVQRSQIRSEKEAILNFITYLKTQRAGLVLAGWNIGYEMAPRSQQLGAGFDIGYMIERASKYGLREPLVAELGKHTIRDIGQEFAIRMTQEAMKYGHLMEKNLYGGFTGYLKYMGGPVEEKDIPMMAKHMTMNRRRVVGWKQEMVHSLLFPGIKAKAHLSEEDVKMGISITQRQGPIFTSEAQAAKYFRDVRIQSLVSITLLKLSKLSLTVIEF